MEFADVLKRNFSAISDDYKTFCAEKDNCRLCSVYNEYKQVVASEGNALNPTFVLIGECAGKEEAEQNRPFIGRAGQRLRKELRKHSNTFNKKTTLITNILSCRPKDNKFPDNNQKFEMTILNFKAGWFSTNTVFGEEIINNCVEHWLNRELKLLKPKVIVTLGAHALKVICNEQGITSCHGAWRFSEKYRAWVLPTYHPSYVLRCENDPKKDYIPSEFEEDIAKVARTWDSLVTNDFRMRLSPDQWKEYQTSNWRERLKKNSTLPSDIAEDALIDD